MDIGQIVLTVVTGIIGIVLAGYISWAINANKNQFAELLKKYKETTVKEQSETLEILKNINTGLDKLNDKITTLNLELVEKYVRKDDMEKFKAENRDAHKELRNEIRSLERSE